jgi:hypothetical protein
MRALTHVVFGDAVLFGSSFKGAQGHANSAACFVSVIMASLRSKN